MTSSLSHDGWAVPQRDQDAWVYPEGELPALSTANGKDNNSRAWTSTRANRFVLEDSDGRNSWKYVYAILLDNHFVLLETKTRGTGKTESSHVIRPIPLECLRLGNVNWGDALLASQGRKNNSGMFSRIRSGGQPLTEYDYSFTIRHAYSKTIRQYTLYTKYATAVNLWTRDLRKAIQERKNKILLYTPRVLDEGVPTSVPLTHGLGTHITSHALCLSEFSFQGTHYLVVGCTNGIYVRDLVNDSPFRRVLEINEPTSIVAVPEFNEFLVHYESALYSYSLDLIVQVSRGDATPESLGYSNERLAQGRGDVLFMKVGRLFDRTLVVYAAKNKQVTLHVLELAYRNGNRQAPRDRASYQPLGSPMPVSEEPHEATFFLDKIAICASKAIYIVEPMNTINASVKVIPEFSNTESGKNGLLGGLNGTLGKANTLLSLGKSDTQKIIELVSKAKILGLVRYGSNTLIVNDELGFFVDEDGKPAGSRYYVPWECTASAYAHRGPHLLLFSSEIIEIRSVDTGAFIQVIEISHLRLLRCASTDQGMLIGAMPGNAEGDEGRTEKLVEVVRNDK